MELQMYLEEENFEQKLSLLEKTKTQKEKKQILKEIDTSFFRFMEKFTIYSNRICALTNNETFQKQEQIYIANLDLVLMLIKKFQSYFTANKLFIFKTTILYTKAYFYQKSHFNQSIGNQSEIKKHLIEKFQNLEKKIGNYYDFGSGKFYSFDSSYMPFEQQQFGKNSFQAINMCLLYQEIILQQAVYYSINNKNEEALQKTIQAYKVSKQLFDSISDTLSLMILIGPDNLKNFDFPSKKSFIGLKKYVDFIRKQTLPELPENFLWKPESADWKISKNNLNKFLEKKIRQNSDGDFLVDKFDSEMINTFQISEIARLHSPILLIDKLKKPVFNEEFIIRAILLYSCTFYSIAAENRTLSKIILKNIDQEKKAELLFTQQNKNQSSIIQNEINKDQLIKTKGFNLSKLIHEKCLEILLFGFPTNIILFDNFLKKYEQHYLKIDTIPEEDEPSKSPTKKSKSEYLQFEEESISQHQEQINRLKNQIYQKVRLDKKSQNKSISKVTGQRKNKSFKRPRTSKGLGFQMNLQSLKNQNSFNHRKKKSNTDHLQLPLYGLNNVRTLNSMKDDDFDRFNDSNDSESFMTESKKTDLKKFDKKTRKKLKTIKNKNKSKKKKL